MFVDMHEELGGNILILNLSGKLTKDDYAFFGPEVEHAVKTVGKQRILVQMIGFHGWTLGAVWDVMKFDLHHYSHIERLALVGDKRWEAGMALFCKPFTTTNVRYFDESKADQAMGWIYEGIEQTTSANS